MSWRMWLSFSQFVLLNRRVSILIALILIVAFAAGVFGSFDPAGVRTLWSDKLEPFISLATFLVALLVWRGEAHQDWLASLHCKLTAVFVYDGREVLRCDHADMANESDMRALGQQLGRHMNGGKDLSMALPALQRSGGAPEEGGDGEVYRHYIIRLSLLELPEVAKTLSENQVLLWAPPFQEPARPTP